MKKLLGFLLTIGMMIVPSNSIAYPDTNQIEYYDKVGTTQIPDYYNWMEEQKNREQLIDLLMRQNKFYYQYFRNRNSKLRASIIAQLNKYNAKLGTPKKIKRVHNHTDLKNTNRSYLFRAAKDFEIVAHYVSTDRKYLVIVSSYFNTDFHRIDLVDLDTKKVNLIVQGIKKESFNVVGKGIVFSKYDRLETISQSFIRNTNSKLYFYSFATKRTSVLASSENSSAFYVLNITKGWKNRLIFSKVSNVVDRKFTQYYLLDFGDNRLPKPKLIYEGFDVKIVSSVNGKALVKSPIRSNNYSLFLVDLKGEEKPNEIIEGTDDVIDQAILFKDRIVVSYIDGFDSYIRVYDYSGKTLDKVSHPGYGRYNLYVEKNISFKFTWQNPIEPTKTFRYYLDPKTKIKYKQIGESKYGSYQPSNYQYKIVNYESNGRLLPMFLVHKKGLEFDSPKKVHISVYGGFGHRTEIYFNILNTYLMDQNIVIAFPIVSGSGDLGYNQFKNGTGLNKINTVNNLNDAVKYLIAEGYTEEGMVSSIGESNGAKVVASAGLLEPQLYHSVISIVGPHDLISYFEGSVGFLWSREYGHPNNEKSIQSILRFSPYHIVQENLIYPRFFIVTSLLDDRVVPWHSAKLAAKLQNNEGNTVLLYSRNKAGHFHRDTKSHIFDRLLFLIEGSQ